VWLREIAEKVTVLGQHRARLRTIRLALELLPSVNIGPKEGFLPKPLFIALRPT
jgi:hypothetical protein